jgi:SAM-dependent methyltransferase
MTRPETKEHAVEVQAGGLRPTAACGPSPSAWIARFAHLIPAGAPVLDVACGGGRHSLFFLERGHKVTAVDRDVAAMVALGPRAGLEVVRADLEAPGSVWPFAGRLFGAVVVVNYLWRPLFPDLIAAVAPRGVLLYDTFAVGQERHGKPRNPDHLLKPGELLDAVGGKLEVRAYECGEVGDPPMVRQSICAVRLGG